MKAIQPDINACNVANIIKQLPASASKSVKDENYHNHPQAPFRTFRTHERMKEHFDHLNLAHIHWRIVQVLRSRWRRVEDGWDGWRNFLVQHWRCFEVRPVNYHSTDRGLLGRTWNENPIWFELKAATAIMHGHACANHITTLELIFFDYHN